MDKGTKKKIEVMKEISKHILSKLKEEVDGLDYCNHDKKVELVEEKNGDSFCMACVRDIIRFEAKKEVFEGIERELSKDSSQVTLIEVMSKEGYDKLKEHHLKQ